jgi:hypothetical protein
MYQFTITIASDGKNADEAWNEAVTALAIDPGCTPEDYILLNDNDQECERYGTGEDSFWTDPAYWDCDCPDNKPYIHSKEQGNYCPVCRMHEEECTDSRVNEIPDKYDSKYDNAVMKVYEE